MVNQQQDPSWINQQAAQQQAAAARQVVPSMYAQQVPYYSYVMTHNESLL